MVDKRYIADIYNRFAKSAKTPCLNLVVGVNTRKGIHIISIACADWRARSKKERLAIIREGCRGD